MPKFKVTVLASRKVERTFDLDAMGPIRARMGAIEFAKKMPLSSWKDSERYDGVVELQVIECIAEVDDTIHIPPVKGEVDAEVS